jgi:hypothetical protein
MTTVNPPTKPAQIRLTRRSPAYWRVTIDNPPINVMGPEMVQQFQEVINALEADEHVRVVVFDSAVDDYFLNHSDFLAKLEDLTALPAGPTGLPPWPDFLVRLTRVPVVFIALIRGRATGNGSEITLACDLSFASREKAILSQWEVPARISITTQWNSSTSAGRRRAGDSFMSNRSRRFHLMNQSTLLRQLHPLRPDRSGVIIGAIRLLELPASQRTARDSRSLTAVSKWRCSTPRRRLGTGCAGTRVHRDDRPARRPA